MTPTRRRTLPLALLLLLAGCSREDGPPSAPAAAAPPTKAAPTTPADPVPTPPESEPVEPPDPALVAAAARVASMGKDPDVACRYRAESVVDGKSRTWDWYVTRKASSLTTRETASHTGESWHADGKGEVVGYDFLFHGERLIVEYRTGDLRALGIHRSWNTVRSLVNRDTLESDLRPLGSVTVLGQEGTRRFGTIPGGTIQIVWLPGLSLPAEIDRRTTTERSRFVLQEVHVPGEQPWTEPEVGAYRWVDFADLGDHPTDPFLRRIANGNAPFPGAAAMHASCGPTCAPGSTTPRSVSSPRR